MSKFKPTEEQDLITSTNEDIKIVARAGTGKTTTLGLYVNSRPAGSRILYLAFNASVRDIAVERFKDVKDKTIHVQTAHSLAYQTIVRANGYKVAFQLKIEDVMKIIRSQDYKLATHIKKMVELYCNSEIEDIYELDYLGTLFNQVAYKFAKNNQDKIVRGAKLILNKMDKGEIDIIHDFYLKKFQLSKPDLNYDYVLLDEGQDSNLVTLNIFLRQKGVKVIVGDPSQQLYSWRGAINSLERVQFPTYELNTSFRFNSEIADLAKKSITLKSLIDYDNKIQLKGLGNSKKLETKAFLGRSNGSILAAAIEEGIIKKKNKLYFEGGFSGYSFNNVMLIYDLINLKANNLKYVKTPLIKTMKSYKDLADYIEDTDDIVLGNLVKLVNRYDNKLPIYLKQLATKVTENIEEASVIFSSVHRAKGMEYDEVTLLDDFITKEKINKIIFAVSKLEDKYKEAVYLNINEEINILYVAITRTMNRINLPQNLYDFLTV